MTSGRAPDAVPDARLGRLAARTLPADGPGAPLLLAHGLTDDGGCWPDAHLPGDVVHAVDLTGHGRSPRFAADELAEPMDVLAADVADALEAAASRAGRPVVGVGHSMGAGALVLAALAGAPVAALVLEDPRLAHERTPVRRRLGRMRAREHELWRTDPATARAELERGCPGWSRAELDAAADARTRTDPAFLATGISGVEGDDDVQVDLARRVAATVPTLLLTGDRPGVVWERPMIAALGPGPARVVVVPGADHCVRRTRPAGYATAVRPFLAQL